MKNCGAYCAILLTLASAQPVRAGFEAGPEAARGHVEGQTSRRHFLKLFLLSAAGAVFTPDLSLAKERGGQNLAPRASEEFRAYIKSLGGKNYSESEIRSFELFMPSSPETALLLNPNVQRLPNLPRLSAEEILASPVPQPLIDQSYPGKDGAPRADVFVHKSASRDVPEFVEVFENGLPKAIFPTKRGFTHQALVSTSNLGQSQADPTKNGDYWIGHTEDDHRSHQFGRASMPDTSFFHDPEEPEHDAQGYLNDTGRGFHATTGNESYDIGRKASHACVRMLPYNAKAIRAYFKSIGLKNAVIHVDGPDRYDEQIRARKRK
jgi:hypothetical protein